jgi:hypothetical protein
MSDTQVVEMKSEAVVVEKLVNEGEEHLVVVITQETYDAIRAIADTASERGLQDGFEYWLQRLAVQHAKVQENLWKKADDTSIFARAQKGNTQARVAVLASLGIKGDDVQKFLKSLK